MFVWLVETETRWAVVKADDPTSAIQKWVDDDDSIDIEDVNIATRFDLIE